MIVISRTLILLILASATVLGQTTSVRQAAVLQPLAGSKVKTGDTLHIRWSHLPIASPVRIEQWSMEQGRWMTIVDNYRSATSTYDWKIPDNIASGSYRIKVEETVATGASSISSSFFRIETAPVIDPSASGNVATVKNSTTSRSTLDVSTRMRLFPNPAKRSLTVDLAQGGIVGITIVDARGATVGDIRQVSGDEFRRTLTWPENIPSGEYFVVVSNRDGSNITGNFTIRK